MQTFTLDSLSGNMNPETKWIEEKARKQLKEVLEEYVKNCIENDIETCSSNGFFIDMVFQELTIARIKCISEIRKKEIFEQKQENTQ